MLLALLFVLDLFAKTVDEGAKRDYLFYLSVGHTRLKVTETFECSKYFQTFSWKMFHMFVRATIFNKLTIPVACLVMLTVNTNQHGLSSTPSLVGCVTIVSSVYFQIIPRTGKRV